MTVAEAITRKRYPDHRCPEVAERNGNLRLGLHGPGGGMLTGVTLVQAQCGCEVVGSGTLQHPLMIEPCADHRAAMYPGVTTE